MNRLDVSVYESELATFAHEAHKARFPAFAWKAVACDMMGLPVGSRPTNAQIITQPHASTTLWMELTARFEQMTTVRWAEYVESQEEQVHNALTYLGATPDRVAQHFALMGIMGDVEVSCHCPIAHFLLGIYGAWFVHAYRDDSYVDFIRVGNPGGSERFVTEFDDGRRPSLDLFPDRIVTG